MSHADDYPTNRLAAVVRRWTYELTDRIPSEPEAIARGGKRDFLRWIVLLAASVPVLCLFLALHWTPKLFFRN